MSPNKEFWSSSKGFVLAMAGSAIGLGNIWRFSYIMGKYGGAAFMVPDHRGVAGLALAEVKHLSVQRQA